MEEENKKIKRYVPDLPEDHEDPDFLNYVHYLKIYVASTARRNNHPLLIFAIEDNFVPIIEKINMLDAAIDDLSKKSTDSI